MASRPPFLCIVLGHGKQQAVFDRHLPYWENLGLPMLIGCPDDDPLQTNHTRFFTGPSSKNGPLAKRRLINLLKRINSERCNYAVVFEYDSLCLLDKLEPRHGFRGVLKANSEPERFYAPRYATAPWMIDRATVVALLNAAATYPEILEEGMDDRLLSAWAWLARVPVVGHGERGASENTFTPTLWSNLYDAVRSGAKWVHGVKCQSALDMVTQGLNGGAKEMPVYCYYDDPARGDYPIELVKRWADSFRDNGFTPRVLIEADARAHPCYERVKEMVNSFPSVNDPRFESFCWVRWLAYQQAAPGLFADYDVANFNVKPWDIPTAHVTHIGAHCMYMTPQAINEFIDYMPNAPEHAREEGGRMHVSDQILFEDWFGCQWAQKRLCATYGEKGWRRANMLHFTNGWVPKRYTYNLRYMMVDRWLTKKRQIDAYRVAHDLTERELWELQGDMEPLSMASRPGDLWTGWRKDL